MVLLSVLGTAVVTRVLGVSRFGQYATIISVTALVAMVTDSGMTNIASHEYALRDGESRNRVLSALLGLRLSITIVGTVLAIGFAIAAHYDTPLVLGMLVASVATFPLIILHTLAVPLTNELRLGTLTMLELARQVVWVGALVVLAVLRAGVLPLLATLLLANVVLIPVTMRATRRVSAVSLRPSVSGWRELMGATVVFSVASAVGLVYLYGTQLITSLVTSHHQTGLFSLGFRIFLVVYNVPGLVGTAAVPLLARAARDDRERLTYVLQRYLELSIAAGIGVALTLSAASGFIIPLIAGSAFHAAVPVAAIQCFALIGTFVAAPCSYGLLSLHLNRRLLWANIVALTVMVVVTYLLARSNGATGAAVASVVCETTVAVLLFIGLVRVRPQCRPDAAFVSKIAVATLLAAPLAVSPWLPSAPRAVAVALVYSLVVVLTRALPPEIVHALPVGRRQSVT